MATKSDNSIVNIQQIKTKADHFESIQEWLNKELGEKTETQPVFRSESPIFDDWDDITYDSDDDDDLDFLNDISYPDKPLDNQSIPGSEGYGTDTSDLAELFTSQPNLENLSKARSNSNSSADREKTTIEVSKAAEETSKVPVIAFTSSQTVCGAKFGSENKPRIISLKDNHLQGKLPKEAKITKVYQIPTINGGSSVLSKVGVQSRKTVVVKVLKPKNG